MAKEKYNVELLRYIENTITVDGVTFSPIKELIFLHLVRCNNSTQYIHEVLSNPIESKCGTMMTSQTEVVYFVLFNGEIMLKMNLRCMDDSPYWLCKQLLKWGFKLPIKK